MKPTQKLGICSIFIGVVITAYGFVLIHQRYNPHALSFSLPTHLQKVQSTSHSNPIALKIPSLNIFVRILPSHIRDGEWETTERGVSYLLNSPLPGRPGNSILYGHNWDSLLGRLDEIAAGSKVYVIYPDNTSITFTVTGKAVVSPNDYQILAPSEDSRMTLYTCKGWFDTQRLVVTAVKDDSISMNLNTSHE